MGAPFSPTANFSFTTVDTSELLGRHHENPYFGQRADGAGSRLQCYRRSGVTQVTLCDLDATQLEAAKRKLSGLDGGDKVDTIQLDLADEQAATDLMANYDAIVAALPSVAIPMGLRAAIAAGTPWVDLSWPPGDQLETLKQAAEEAGVLVIPGCGVEPGLTEIMTRYLAEKLDSVDEVHIKCGGIPAVPSGPLNYKIVFGGRKMPIRDAASRIAQDGELLPVPRYSGVETFSVDGVGEVEAWHEGFMPWLLELDALKEIKLGTQKTVRWPGYADKIATLRDLGLLSLEPVDGRRCYGCAQGCGRRRALPPRQAGRR